MSEDEVAIHELVDKWMAATGSGDIETVLGLMTDDVLFMVPGREPFGKAQFRAAAESMRSSAIDGRAEIAEIQLLGDWAWIRNRITVSVTPPGGGAVSRAGYTLTILRKGADGRWRLFRDANLVS